MKRISIMFLITFIIISINVYVKAESSNDILNNGRRFNEINKQASKMAVEQLLEPYKSEDVPENERINSYKLTGYGVSDSAEEGNYSISVSFLVEPYLKENSIWKTNTSNLCYTEYKLVDGEIEIVYLSLFPKNYDKFLERFEEYKKNNTENVEIDVVKGNTGKDLKTVQIGKMSNTVFITSGIVFTITAIYILTKHFKLKRK